MKFEPGNLRGQRLGHPGQGSQCRARAADAKRFAPGEAGCARHRGWAGGAEVALCTLTGGGHTWPSGGPFPGGHQSTDLDATATIWDFFVAHPRP